MDLLIKKNAHGSIGLIGKYPTSILSRRYRSKEKHPDHPGETMGLLEICEASGRWQVTAQAGVQYTSLGLLSALSDHSYMFLQMVHRHVKKKKEKNVTKVILIIFF